MKLIVAIIHDDDAPYVMHILNEHGYFVTKLATRGAFLRAGNTTLLIGVEEEKVDDVLKIFEENCKSRTQLTTLTAPYGAMQGYIPKPIEVRVGGATIFILDVEQFVKY